MFSEDKTKVVGVGEEKGDATSQATRSSVSVGEKRLSPGDATREEVVTTTGGHERDVIDAKGLLLVAGGARWVVNDGCREICHTAAEGEMR